MRAHCFYRNFRARVEARPPPSWPAQHRPAPHGGAPAGMPEDRQHTGLKTRRHQGRALRMRLPPPRASQSEHHQLEGTALSTNAGVTKPRKTPLHLDGRTQDSPCLSTD